jgi:penicillin amidase
VKRTLLWLGSAVVMALAVLAVVVWWLLRGSLPQLSGELDGLEGGPRAQILLQRDADGAPTVRGESWPDVAYGLGFLHAQDRFFQMDLSRRFAAGELAALLGSSTVEQDRRARTFRLRQVARQAIAAATVEQREWIEAYTRGVNRGLDALGVRPWEYVLLRATPEPWRAEDSILVLHSMWWQLQHEGVESEIARRSIELRLIERIAAASREEADATRAAEVLRFFFPRGNEWDAPNFPTLQAARDANGGSPFVAPPVPSPDALDLRAASRQAAVGATVGATLRGPAAVAERDGVPGSNAWAVAGAHTASGVALVAGDMHLGLRVPTVWYRARLQITGGKDARSAALAMELNGVTLPGLPVVAAGSNGHIAWSFTNSYGDWVDVRPRTCSIAKGTYVTAQGEQRFRVIRERIEVSRGDIVPLDVYDSPHGVVVERSENDPTLGETCWMARWLISEPGATNLAALELQQVKSVEAALALAPSVGIPHQNFTLGDRSGRIAWTIIGRMPQGELGPETPRPVLWRDAASAPRIVDPEVGRLWSANSRHVEGELERMLGNDEASGGMGYDMGARQGQIRDGLLGLRTPATPADMLAIQLDDRAVFLERWQRLLLATLDEEALRNEPQRAELRRLAADWQGRAIPASVSYRLVRAFRDQTQRASWEMITRTLQAGAGSYPANLFEGSLWRLVTEQPPHMLAEPYADWRAFLLAQVDAVIADLAKRCASLATCTWGERNTSRIRHPLSASLGPLARYLDMPPRPLPGDNNMPRVVGPGFGASERFAVSPGREAEGYLQIPGGQSGHPLSPFYRAGYEDWVTGRARPLLPGQTVHTLVLKPAAASGE